MDKTYVLRISGTSFSIVSDENETYIRNLEEKVNRMTEAAQLRGASRHKAALFVCMELCDEVEKLKAKLNDAKNSKSEVKKKSSEELFFPDKDQVSFL